MNTYKLKISSPDGDVFNDEVAALHLRGADGDLAILAGHIPFITSVKPCECRIEYDDGDIKKADIKSGILTVGEKDVILLSSKFNWK